MIIKFNQLCLLELPKCDHCEKTFDPFKVTILHGGTSWCMSCFEKNIDTVENKQEIEVIEKAAVNNYSR